MPPRGSEWDGGLHTKNSQRWRARLGRRVRPRDSESERSLKRCVRRRFRWQSPSHRALMTAPPRRRQLGAVARSRDSEDFRVRRVQVTAAKSQSSSFPRTRALGSDHRLSEKAKLVLGERVAARSGGRGWAGRAAHRPHRRRQAASTSARHRPRHCCRRDGSGDGGPSRAGGGRPGLSRRDTGRSRRDTGRSRRQRPRSGSGSDDPLRCAAGGLGGRRRCIAIIALLVALLVRCIARNIPVFCSVAGVGVVGLGARVVA